MIAVDGLSVRAGGFALDGVSFEVPKGGYAVLMGRTGCGKTTLLETICGLRAPDRGRVLLDGRDVTGLAPGERGIGYVPQDRALFRTMNVAENVGFALRVAGRPAAEIDARVGDLARSLGIERLLERRIDGLSGGEAQRVALGRALAASPALLLLDEPLAGLDEETREGMIDLLRAVRAGGVTILHVTHSRHEAERLADRRLVLENGRVTA